ncbi:RHS repeat-associated core domain-containing protein [Pseudomonas viridiflava]|uniref:RHS repeat-associated core domain-containing protein n=1 Tax=Pseudomonas viridiflava TaxID=33069 RepID=A0AA46ZY04_PSEVI|nr:RHS repeat-associated core domain-containing protein [Pseudomonas viridiflava]MBV1813993.1 RHS repeat-associated core domain-containing protein [Pseudomonas viridiflava]UZA71382.1 RHS repeat-associated core domain-containing protein [Pseudomonas viridiflava]
MAHNTTFCLYRYDPLDRLATRTPLAEAISKVFYKADVLVTETQGGVQRSFVHHDRRPLAQQTLVGTSVDTLLTAADQQHSVLSALSAAQQQAIAYSPHGHRAPLNHLPGFNGEQPDPVTGHYLLGNGYRAYNPVLMRFNRPDKLSPFGKGGLNAYAYCAGDPVNRNDPSGHELIDTLISVFYIAAGLATAGIGLAIARPSFKAVFKGVKVKPATADVGRQSLPLRRNANTTEKLSAGVAAGAITTGLMWGAAFTVKNVDPDSPVHRPLAAIALAMSLTTLGFRGFAFARSRVAARPAPSTPIPAPASNTPSRRSIGIQTDSIRSRASSVRSNVPDQNEMQETRL